MQHLIEKARSLRRDIILMIDRAQAGHTGGSLSVIDILVALYYGGVLRHDPASPRSLDRDYLILSKAHASPALYAVLADRGFFEKAHLDGFRRIDSLLQGHVTTHIPGVEISGGSLGQGLSVACGIALGLQMDGKNNRTYCIVGDGELQEGQNWEALMTGAKYALKNLTLIVDANGLQIDGAVEEVMPLPNLSARFAAFGWEVVEVDGHDIPSLVDALSIVSSVPRVVIARTVKGKGAPAAEGVYGYHGKPLTPEHLAEALAALS